MNGHLKLLLGCLALCSGSGKNHWKNSIFQIQIARALYAASWLDRAHYVFSCSLVLATTSPPFAREGGPANLASICCKPFQPRIFQPIPRKTGQPGRQPLAPSPPFPPQPRAALPADSRTFVLILARKGPPQKKRGGSRQVPRNHHSTTQGPCSIMCE